MIWLIMASVVAPLFTPVQVAKSPTEYCFQQLGILERPSTPEAIIQTMDSPEFRKCMTWAPKDTDAHVPMPTAMEQLERIPPKGR